MRWNLSIGWGVCLLALGPAFSAAPVAAQELPPLEPAVAAPGQDRADAPQAAAPTPDAVPSPPAPAVDPEPSPAAGEAPAALQLAAAADDERQPVKPLTEG